MRLAVGIVRVPGSRLRFATSWNAEHRGAALEYPGHPGPASICCSSSPERLASASIGSQRIANPWLLPGPLHFDSALPARAHADCGAGVDIDAQGAAAGLLPQVRLRADGERVGALPGT